MVGNLLDNAWRQARSASQRLPWTHRLYWRSRTTARGSATALAEALIAGRRLDERGDGHGFGLPIALELAEMNGGSLELARASAGGLAARLTLPLQSS